MASAKRTVAVLLAGLVLAGLVLTGCGVPAHSGPAVVGEAPKAGTESEATAEQPPTPDGAGSAAELVDRFLQAAAWGNDPDVVNEAVARVQRFLTPAAQETWPRGAEPGLTIVHTELKNQPVGRTGAVTMSMQPIGVLNSAGTIEPVAAAPQSVEYSVQSSTDGQQLRIDAPLPQLHANDPSLQLPRMLLSDDKLDHWYEPHPIYFWAQSQKESILIPDLRYLAKSVPQATRPNVILTWLRGGPSRWLQEVADALPPEISSKDKPVLNGSTLQVNLSANAESLQPVAIARFVAQLRWSLLPISANVQLQVEGQARQVDGSSGTGYLAYNPAASSAPSDTEPDEYCVIDGKVVRIASKEPLPPVLLPPSHNSGVVSAAMPRGTLSVALVERSNATTVQLEIGLYDKNQKYTRYGPGVVATATVMSRPQWLSSPSPRVFVMADHKLRQFVDQKEAPVATEASLGSITAFAVAPGARRIAMIVGDRLLVAPLSFDDDGRQATVGPPLTLRTGLTGQTGVAWSHEERVVVAGRDANGPALAEVTVDGALLKVEPLSGLGQLNVTALVGYTQRPGLADRLSLMIQTGDGDREPFNVYKVYSSGAVSPLTDAALPAPSPSASPSKPTTPPIRSPFFLD
jgi:hypothetical protein